MDKSSFCDSIQTHLIDLEGLVQSELTLAPATIDKAQEIAARRSALEDAARRAAALRSRIETLRVEPGPLDPATRTEVMAELDAIRDLVR
jgi:hypothetical protein